MNKYNIAVIGANYPVGSNILNMLIERNFPYGNVYALSSGYYHDKKVSFGDDKTLVIEDYRNFDFSKADLVFISSGIEIGRSVVEKIIQYGAVVIDASFLYNLDPNIPLIIPEVNFFDSRDVSKYKIISNPKAVTIGVVAGLVSLHNAYKIKRLTISTYQAVSDCGKDGMDELYSQTKNKYMQGDNIPKIFPKPIAFNIIPQIGNVDSEGCADEENQVSHEIRRFFGNEIEIAITSVTVPVFIGHTISVNVEFFNQVDLKEACELLEEEDYIVLSREKSFSPIDIVGDDCLYISRIRGGEVYNMSLNLIISLDNLRKGAAVNALQIAEQVIALN